MGLKSRLKLGRKKEQSKRQKQAENFIKEYTTLCEKYKIQFDAIIEITDEGILPRMGLKPHKPKKEIEVKDWKKCKKENEEQKNQNQDESTVEPKQ